MKPTQNILISFVSLMFAAGVVYAVDDEHAPIGAATKPPEAKRGYVEPTAPWWL